MGKASRKKRREGNADVGPQAPAPHLPSPPSWAAPLLLAAAAMGVVLAGVSTWVHRQVTSSGGAYASFCNVSETIDCDSVVTSSYGELFGTPVSVWAIGFYLLLGAVAWRSRSRIREVRDRARADAFALAVGGAVFSLYLAAVSAFVLGALCLLCAGLYVVSAVALAAAVTLASPVTESLAILRGRWEGVRRRPVLSTGVAAAIVLVLALPAWLGAPTLMTRDEIFRTNPEFYDWYTNQPVVRIPASDGHARGPTEAPIQIVEFSDFECPHCRRAHVTLKDLLSRYPDEVRFVFRHFPLSSLCNPEVSSIGHEHACQAAAASECAGEQQKFDEYSNLLFARQNDLSPKVLRDLAGRARLDEAAFEKCLESEEPMKRVRADIERARQAGVRSTPTFFINDRRLEGNLTYENWLLAFGIELDRG